MSLSNRCKMVSGWILGGKREPSLPPDIRLHPSVVQCGRWLRPLNLSKAANIRMSVAPVKTVMLSWEVPFFCLVSENKNANTIIINTLIATIHTLWLSGGDTNMLFIIISCSQNKTNGWCISALRLRGTKHTRSCHSSHSLWYALFKW